jgi:hypothetical protein
MCLCARELRLSGCLTHAVVWRRAPRWYAGGKIEVQVGKKTLWAQVGMNITIVGAKEWDED